jgi:hypothetical protein
MLNSTKLERELKAAGVEVSGCNSAGVVWDLEGNEIQSRVDVAAVIELHDPTPEIILTDAERIAALEDALLALMLGGV